MKRVLFKTAFLLAIGLTTIKTQAQYTSGLSNGAKLWIRKVDNQARVYVSVDGGPENMIADIPYADYDPDRNIFVNIIPVNSGFLKTYTVRIELKNEINPYNVNPMHFLGQLFSVGDDASNNYSGHEVGAPIQFTTAGSGYSGVVQNIIFTVQKK